jgi:hypothetical protein
MTHRHIYFAGTLVSRPDYDDAYDLLGRMRLMTLAFLLDEACSAATASSIERRMPGEYAN